MGAVQEVHGAAMSDTPIPMLRLEQKANYYKPTLECQFFHLQASPAGETNINGDTLVKIRGLGAHGLNGIPVTLC